MMSRRWKGVLWAAAAAFIAYVAVGIYRAGQNELRPPNANAQIVFKGGAISGRRITTRSWSADYDRIVSNADQTLLNVDGVHNGIVYKKGRPYIRLRAAHMAVNTITHDFTVSGSLHAETTAAQPARSFDTTSAMWNDARQELTLDKRVVIHTAGGEPLTIASAVFDVKTGLLDVHGLRGPIR
ncbi:MAG: hypothetical protein GIX03_00410 [Candidatus Eremiobacteraeota bacterium]|nr:hypothetical protein [Candidatus Eremiobacteraeota bacterium]MBC5801484.1 hypothetical protein [Candidatus Eremiobacteraeota bacterium]MBC5822223.1 hypothetical protein [Candidatus Eremiobacteraeota bacterium]